MTAPIPAPLDLDALATDALDAMERLSESFAARCTANPDCRLPHNALDAACAKVLALTSEVARLAGGGQQDRACLVTVLREIAASADEDWSSADDRTLLEEFDFYAALLVARQKAAARREDKARTEGGR